MHLTAPVAVFAQDGQALRFPRRDSFNSGKWRKDLDRLSEFSVGGVASALIQLLPKYKSLTKTISRDYIKAFVIFGEHDSGDESVVK